MSEKTGKGRKGNGHKGKERRKGAGTLEKRGRVYIARWTVDARASVAFFEGNFCGFF